MKKLVIIILVIAAVIGARVVLKPKAGEKLGEAGRKVLFYQSAMHPWIKSDKPGRCTICGMELTPVYEGDTGFDATGGEDVVPLSQSMIQVMNVETVEAKVQQVAKTLRVAGTIEENQSRHRVLSAYIPGRIQKLYVNYLGAEVKEGEPLAEFYSAVLLQAEREYKALTGDFQKAVQSKLLQMGLTTEQIQDLAEKPTDKLTSQILAPMSGTVVVQNIYEGQYVQEGEKLFEIADFSNMWFQFQVYERDLPWIKLGLKVEISTPAHPGKTFSGKIIFIDPNIDEVTRATRARVEFENPLEGGRRLLAKGVYADGEVTLEPLEALAVPRAAVIQTGRDAVVYVDKGGGAYERRVIKRGVTGDKLVQVLAGVSEAEKVVVNGNLLLDSQAEMNRTFAQVATPEGNEMKLPKFTEGQVESISTFFDVAAELSQVLAADNLDGFNSVVDKVNQSVAKLHEATAGHPIEGEAHVLAGAPLKKAGNLESAREQFYPFTKLAVALAEKARRNDERFKELRVFKCPMAPGPGKTSFWVQKSLPLRNPFYGAEMLECGSEVKAP